MTLWRYHLGVHKTATTHIQRVLESLRADLLPLGLDYIPTGRLRAAEPLFRKREPFKKLRFQRIIRSTLPVALVSEENWLGQSWDACQSQIYPSLERRLRVICKPNAKAFIAIRNPADFAASVYSEAIRHSPNRVSRQATREAFLARESPWLPLIDRIMKFFPDLLVWQYEDYRGNEQAFISLVVGRPVAVPFIGDPPETKRLSAEAVRAMEAARPFVKQVARAHYSPASTARQFEMFSSQERAQLTQTYEHDLGILRLRGLLRTPQCILESLAKAEDQ